MSVKRMLPSCLLVLLTWHAFSQHRDVFKLHRLPQRDTLANGWVLHEGDDPAWASPQFYDGDWQAVDPSTDITKFKPLKESGVAWVRLHIKVDTGITDGLLAMHIYQYTATAVYLDGKLAARFGYIGKDTWKTRAVSPVRNLLPLNINDGREHVLAVRLGYQSGIPYISPWYEPLPAFGLFINSYTAAQHNSELRHRLVEQSGLMFSVLIGMFFIIGMTSLLVYLFDHSQRVNLYYAIYAFNFCISTILSLPFFTDLPYTAWQMWSVFGVTLTWAVSNLFILLTVYSLFQYQRRTVFTLFIAVTFTGIIWLFWSDVNAYIFCTTVLADLCLIEGIRVCFWAIKQNKKGGALVLGGLAIYLVLITWQVTLNQVSIKALTVNCVAFLSFPIGMAFYLGVQAALNNKKLRASLKETQQLSEQKLAVEQEKQAILGNQNEMLEQQVTERTMELNRSLVTLKQAQSQLIQSEKMASLGELTAGIAHEIQNPLNFVNNFSDVNREMLEELKAESEKPKAEQDEQLVTELINDLVENEQKINHHGKRADAIVKGMLEHSRASTGQKELTDLNKLADEYIRLAYHGLQAKDKRFNAELVTYFEPNLPLVNTVPQDIGRVLLNLFNNAFYAVQQKQLNADDNYKATVEVATAVKDQQVQLTVKDNGTGIPDAIKDKIMQPFFTTKPTGQGTGLGLSLSYDIVVKGYGGNITANSRQGEGSEFVIQIPLVK